MAETNHEVQPEHAPEAHPQPATDKPVVQASPTLAKVQSIRAQGWEAIEQVASTVKQHVEEWPVVAHWLHQNRGNDFVQHVQKQMDAPTTASAPTAEGTHAPAGPTPAAPEKKPTKYPIVLLHGLGAGPSSFASEIPAAMKAEGDAVFEITAPPYESPEERAKAIAPQLEDILKKTDASKLNLIAWSLGGLDARYLISSMGWGPKIASLSMVGTPNRGAATADKVMSALPAAETALSTLHGLLGKIGGMADAVPGKVDPALNAINGAALKALNLARELHIAPKSDPNTKQEGPDQTAPDIAKVNQLAAEIGALAKQYNAKLPANVADALNTLAKKLGGDIHNSMANDADVIAAISALTEANAAKFNKENPDAKGVYYQSWAGVASNSGHLDNGDASKVGKLANPNGDPHQVGNIGDQSMLEAGSYLSRSQSNGKLNDGAVPVESAQWGNYRGAIPADHNHLTRPTSDADKKRTGFDVVDFYKQMAEDLSDRGY